MVPQQTVQLLSLDIFRLACRGRQSWNAKSFPLAVQPQACQRSKCRLDRLQERDTRLFLERSALVSATVGRPRERQDRFVRGRCKILEQRGFLFFPAAVISFLLPRVRD